MLEVKRPVVSKFKARLPRTADEVTTCARMLIDSPYYNKKYFLHLDSIQKAFEHLLSSGSGYIVIVENDHHTPTLRRKNNSYEHIFCSYHAMAYVTLDFVKTAIRDVDIPDIGMFFLESYLEHLSRGTPSPAALPEEIILGNNDNSECGVYCISLFFVRHPALPLIRLRMIEDAQEYSNCIRNTSNMVFGGRSHHVWLHNIVGDFAKIAYENAGHRLLRGYPGNKPLINILENKYLLCLVRDEQISERVGIPPGTDCVLTDKFGNWYKDTLFAQRNKKSNLSEKQQYYCYLMAIGYNQEQIIRTMFPNDRRTITQLSHLVSNYQHHACEKLANAGYDVRVQHIDGGYRNDSGKLRDVIRENLHEVRSFIFPLYPYPEGFPGEFYF